VTLQSRDGDGAIATIVVPDAAGQVTK